MEYYNLEGAAVAVTALVLLALPLRNHPENAGRALDRILNPNLEDAGHALEGGGEVEAVQDDGALLAACLPPAADGLPRVRPALFPHAGHMVSPQDAAPSLLPRIRASKQGRLIENERGVGVLAILQMPQGTGSPPKAAKHEVQTDIEPTVQARQKQRRTAAQVQSTDPHWGKNQRNAA